MHKRDLQLIKGGTGVPVSEYVIKRSNERGGERG